MRHADDEKGDEKGSAEKRGCEAGARMEVGGHIQMVEVGWSIFVVRKSLLGGNFVAYGISALLVEGTFSTNICIPDRDVIPR